MLKIINTLKVFVGFGFKVGLLICIVVIICLWCFHRSKLLVEVASTSSDGMIWPWGKRWIWYDTAQNIVIRYDMVPNRDGRLSDPAIQIRPVFHWPVKPVSGWIICGVAGRIFANYSTPFCTKSDVTAQLTVGISRENLPMKPVDWCRRPPAVCSGANCSRRSRSPLAHCPPINVHALLL